MTPVPFPLLAVLLRVVPLGALDLAVWFQQQQPTFNFKALGLAMAAISFGLIGVLMAGAAFFGEAAERAKRTWLPVTIQGLILIGVSSFIMSILGTAVGTP